MEQFPKLVKSQMWHITFLHYHYLISQLAESTSKSEVQRKGQILRSTMKNFGVNAKVKQIKIGPAVTQYEIQPAQGVKVSKIVNLHNDIALALASKRCTN